MNILTNTLIMRRTVLFLFVVLISIAFFSCNSGSKKQNDLTGKWQNTKTDTIDYILEIGENHVWKYYKNDELLEKGTFEINENMFIMKHVVPEHDHSHEGGDHSHAHPEDHRYEFKLNENKSELNFMSEGKTSVFKRIK